MHQSSNESKLNHTSEIMYWIQRFQAAPGLDIESFDGNVDVTELIKHCVQLPTNEGFKK